MKVRVLGGGWFGCHIAATLIRDGHDVVLHETRDRLFGGASGNNPARLHIGCHYPRSHATRAACQQHFRGFMAEYGHLTRCVRTNLYAIAESHSLVDFETYRSILRGEIEFITVDDPTEYGLRSVEGAMLVRERHIIIDDAREHFSQLLGDAVALSTDKAGPVDSRDYDMTVDCTFCAKDSAGIDRYEPCLVVLLKGPTDTAVTIMDGPFPSVYPWNEEAGLCSLSSARYTPFSKQCGTMQQAQWVLDGLKASEVRAQAERMMGSMATFYPAVHDLYEIADCRLSIRAMPLSAADTRLVDLVRVGDRAVRIRAGKIDAIMHAAEMVRGELMRQEQPQAETMISAGRT